MGGRRGSWVLSFAALVLAACGDGAVELPLDGVVSGSRLRARSWQSGDGARLFMTFHDTERGEDCGFLSDPDGVVMRCLPPIWNTSLFADAACTRPMFTTGMSGSCPAAAPPYLGVFDESTCAWGITTVWEAVGFSPVTVYERDDAGACVGSAPLPDSDYYTTGDEVPLTAFVRGEVVRVDGPSRLDDLVVQGEDGSRIRWRTVDEGLGGATCAIWGVHDDPRRCYPDAWWVGAYADDACTEPLGVVHAACANDVAPYVFDLRFGDQTCGGEYSIWELGESIEPATVYVETQDACVSTPASTDTAYARAGTPIPLEHLVTATPYIPDVGGRLRRRVLRTDDGYEVGAGFHDTELQTDCWIVRVSDGTFRCVPAVDGSNVRGAYFSDAACTEPVRVAERWTGVCDDGSLSPHVHEWVPPAVLCDESHVRVWERGAELASGSIYTLSPLCAPYTFDPAVIRYFEVGRELEPAELVELTQVVE